MINYYDLFRISPNISEVELLRELSKRLVYYQKKLTNNNIELKNAINDKIRLINDFKKTIDSYGGKNGYDRALELSKKKKSNVITTNDNLFPIEDYRTDKQKKKRYGLVIGAIAATVVVISGFAIDAASHEKIKVPVYPGETYEDFMEYYDVNNHEIKEFSSSGAEVKVKNKKVPEIEEKIKERLAEEKKYDTEYYAFKYAVEWGDTISSLATRYKTNKEYVNSGNPNLVSGKDIIIYTPYKDIADEMNEEYNREHQVSEVAYTYVIQDGDTIKTISDKTNVSMNEILNFNGLSADDTLYAGQILKIPKISKTK